MLGRVRWLPVAALVVLVAACGSEDEPPRVDWTEVTQAQRTVIDREVDEGDCEGMQAAFDNTEVADVLSYLDWHMKDAGC